MITIQEWLMGKLKWAESNETVVLSDHEQSVYHMHTNGDITAFCELRRCSFTCTNTTMP